MAIQPANRVAWFRLGAERRRLGWGEASVLAAYREAARGPLRFGEEEARRVWRPVVLSLAALGRYADAVAFVDDTARRRVGEAAPPRGAHEASSGEVGPIAR